MIEFNQNLANVEVKDGTFDNPQAGGFILQCIGVESKSSKAGNPMLVLSFDIADGKYKGNYAEHPRNYYQLINADQLGRVKGILQSFQKSNGSKLSVDSISQSSFNEQNLKGLYVGAVLRAEEYLNKDNEARMGLKVFYICSIDTIKAGDFTIPNPKLLEATGYSTEVDKRSAEEIDKSLPF